MAVKHTFVSAYPDGPDSTKLRPSNWNAEHAFSGGAVGELLYRDTGASDGASWLAGAAAGSVLVSGGVGAAPAWSASPSLTALTASNIAGAALQISASSGALTLTAPAGAVLLAPGNTNIFANGSVLINGNAYTLTFGATQDLSLSRDGADILALRRSTNAQRLNLGQGNAALAAGRLAMGRDAAAAFAPGAGYGMLRWETGTNAGTLKLVAYSGTSTTGVTVADNVGGGN